jgi:hypothetical protein
MKFRMIPTLLVISAVLFACQNGQNPAPEPDALPIESSGDMGKPLVDSDADGQIGEFFTLGEGESLWIEEDQFQVTVVGVLSDSRCPEGTNCFWEGNAKVQLTVNAEDVILTLGGLREGDQNSAPLGDGLTIRVIQITPYPGSAQEGQPYQITLIVERETSQPYDYPVGV